MMDKPPTDPNGYQYLGALVGALGGILYFWPKNLRDTIVRLVFSFSAGSSLYFVAMDMFHWEMSKDRIIGAAVIVAFLSWPLAGAVVKKARDRLSSKIKED